MRLSSLGRGCAAIVIAFSAVSLSLAAEPAVRKAIAAKAAKGEPARPATAKIDPLDWPEWRGPEQNGISRETGLIDSWDPESDENVIWKNEELAGISSPIVLRGKLYTIVRDKPDTKKEQEKVVCVDSATGKKIWENGWNVFLSDVPAERVGWSHVAGDPKTGKIYVQGVGGYFQCLDGETGKSLWSHSLSEEYGLLSTYGGRTNSPVVFEDLVITSSVIIGWGEMAKPTHRYMAFNKATGEMVWFTGTKPLPKDTTYSTPFMTAIKGQAAMVFGSGDGSVWAFQPRTGKALWNYQFSLKGLNVSPIVADGVAYDGQSEENFDSPTTMGSVVALDATKSGDITKDGAIWKVPDIGVGRSSPLLIDGRLYICDEAGKLFILDSKTGEQVGKAVRLIGNMRSSPVYADGKIYACTNGGWHILKPTKEGVKVVQKVRLPSADDVAGSPAISHGRIYVPTGAQMYCLGVKGQKPAAAEERPAPPEETAAGKDDKPAQVQVVPCEVLLGSGGQQQFKVRVYNERGQLLKETAADFSAEGSGEIDKQGQYTAEKSSTPSAAIITAKVGDLSGQARIRIVPPLPWKFDFNKIPLVAGPMGGKEGEPPVTWIGARYRHKIREVDGEKVMVKITTIPLGTRSQSWMGPTDLHDYTVQADLMGAEAENFLPDMGVIAQRYTLDLMGQSQQLQVRSWTSQVATRFSKTVPFEWKPKVWYTMKFKAAVEDGKAVLRGKVWPRDESEPTKWTVEAIDEVPNTHGSPGLFGNATNAEVFIDNIQVSKN